MERCYRCRRPSDHCWCRLCRPITTRTEIVIVQHGREAGHPFNSARILAATLTRLRLITAWGAVPRPPELATGTALLYPGPDAVPLDACDHPPERLVIIDGTWSHARIILRHNPWLAALPRVGLAPTRPSNYRIRLEPKPECLSSVEATVAALRLLEPDTADLDHPLEVFNHMIDRQIDLRADHERVSC